MNSYIWKLFSSNADHCSIAPLLTWAIVARVDEAAALYGDDHVAKQRLVNRPLDYKRFLAAIENAVHSCEVYVPYQRNINVDKLKTHFPQVDRIDASPPRRRERDGFKGLVSSTTVEGITTVACACWLFRILKDNKEFAKKFFDSRMYDLVHQTNAGEGKKIENFIVHFYKNVVKLIARDFEAEAIQDDTVRVLERATMLGLVADDFKPAEDDVDGVCRTIKAGTHDDLLTRISAVLFKLQGAICPTIAQTYPVHFSAWSLCHAVVVSGDETDACSNLFMVGRQSRGLGTHHYRGGARLVRDAIFSFMPARDSDKRPDEQPPSVSSYAGYISGEEKIGYGLVGHSAKDSDKVGSTMWWEYSGRSAGDNMKLFFISQHVEPRTVTEQSINEPRIFNALMLGHIRDAERGDLPGIWIGMVKRLKPPFQVNRPERAAKSGFWGYLDAERDDLGDLIFTSECHCFHNRVHALMHLYHDCALVGHVADQDHTSEGVATVLNATYGFGDNISDLKIGFPMQLSASFFVIAGDDPRYALIDNTFFAPALVSTQPPDIPASE
jgi:hypothetical protein